MGLWVMTARVEISLYMGLLGCGIIVLRGLTYFGDTRPVCRGHSQNFFYIFFYIFPICWGSEPLWWVMTARAEISLFMGYLHGVDTGLRGPASIGHIVFFGPDDPLGIYIFYIYWGGRNHFGG